MTTKTEWLNSLNTETRAQITSSRKVDHNTHEATYRNGDRGVWLHKTEIIRFTADGHIVLNSGGYRTNVTKDRTNSWLPSGLYVYQEKGIWYVTSRKEGRSLEYTDGMVLPNGNLPAAPIVIWREWRSNEVHIWYVQIPTHQRRRKFYEQDEAVQFAEKAAAKNPGQGVVQYPFGQPDVLSKQITAFCRKIDLNKPLIEPDAGDCFYCAARQPNSDCLWIHVNEGYLHGSLLRNALQADKRISPFTYEMLYSGRTQFKDLARRALSKYLKTHLGLAK